MTDRFDDAKRALEGVPAPDVWAEAERRAADGTVVPLATSPGGGGGRHRGRWLAGAAAVAVLAVGTVAVLAADDEAPVDTVPSSDDPAGRPENVTIYQADGACKLGIIGEPLPEPAAVSAAETFVSSSVGTLVQGSLNGTQTYAVQVPGQVVTDLVGERVEDVQVERGTAQLWFQPVGPDGRPAVQLRWFTGSQEVCESFTVTVGGATEDENRHAALDLAERVLMSGELPDDEPAQPTPGANPLAGTAWQLERSTIDGVPTEGSGSVFTFGDADMEWTDGCNGKFASYTFDDGRLMLDAVGTTDVLCDPNPTSDAINAAMTEGGIAVVFDGDFLILRTLDAELTLRPLVRDQDPVGSEATTTTAPAAAGEETDTTLAPTTSTVPLSTTSTVP